MDFWNELNFRVLLGRKILSSALAIFSLLWNVKHSVQENSISLDFYDSCSVRYVCIYSYIMKIFFFYKNIIYYIVITQFLRCVVVIKVWYKINLELYANSSFERNVLPWWIIPSKIFTFDLPVWIFLQLFS